MFTLRSTSVTPSIPFATALLLSLRCRIPTLVLFVLCSMLRAQQTAPPAALPPAGSNWAHVKALPPETRVHITTDHGGKTCRIFAVSDDALTCAKGGNTAGAVLQRQEIKYIKLAHYLRSTLVGAGIGGGAGAIAGGISGRSGPCNSSRDFCFGSIIGVGGAAAIVGGAGAAVGGLIGGATDMTRGSSIYVRP